MKISDLSPLAQLQRAAQIPVAIAGENRNITLGQIIDALQSVIIPFNRVAPKNPATLVQYAAGSTALPLPIWYDPNSMKFCAVKTSSATVVGLPATSIVFYNEFPGSDIFNDENGATRTDCLFIADDGRLYRFTGSALISAGLTDDQAALLKKLTPQKVNSESELEAMQRAGEIIPGQIYYIPENE